MRLKTFTSTSQSFQLTERWEGIVRRRHTLCFQSIFSYMTDTFWAPLDNVSWRDAKFGTVRFWLKSSISPSQFFQSTYRTLRNNSEEVTCSMFSTYSFIYAQHILLHHLNRFGCGEQCSFRRYQIWNSKAASKDVILDDQLWPIGISRKRPSWQLTHLFCKPSSCGSWYPQKGIGNTYSIFYWPKIF